MLRRPVVTRIVPLDRFYLAEDYHQKYRLRQDRVLMNDFRAMFGDDEKAFVDSTSAAKVNGLVGVEGTNTQLDGIIGQLGLSEAGRSELVRRIRL